MPECQGDGPFDNFFKVVKGTVPRGAAIQQEGFFVFIRDNTWMGFPACQIIIPGMCELSKGFFDSPESYTREFLSRRFSEGSPELFMTGQKEDRYFLQNE